MERSVEIQRVFLFGQSLIEGPGEWGWDPVTGTSVPPRAYRHVIDRRVAVEDLVLEYLLAVVVAGLAQLGANFLRDRPAKSRRKADTWDVRRRLESGGRTTSRRGRTSEEPLGELGVAEGE